MIKGAPDGSGRSTVTELSERLQLAQSTVTELVRRAEEAGLIERERSQVDGRVAFLSLTAEGERRLERTHTSLSEERRRLRQAFAHLDAGSASSPAPTDTERSSGEVASTSGNGADPHAAGTSGRSDGQSPGRRRRYHAISAR